MASVFTGCIPALMIPCTPDRKPDFAALVRKGKELMAAGMSAVVYCGSMGDWPLLTDAERQEGVHNSPRLAFPSSSAPERRTPALRLNMRRMPSALAPRG